MLVNGLLALMKIRFTGLNVNASKTVIRAITTKYKCYKAYKVNANANSQSGCLGEESGAILKL